MAINSQGLRDVEHEYRKPAGVVRVLVMGDSFVEGVQVPLDELFTRVLERQLNGAGGRRFEVISAGVNGWGTDNEALFYEHEGRRYRPDLVLLAFYAANDVSDNNAAELGVAPGPKPRFSLDPAGGLVLRDLPLAVSPPAPPAGGAWNSLKLFLVRNSRLYDFARKLIPLYLPGFSQALGRLGLVETTLNTRYASDASYEVFTAGETAPAWSRAWALTEALLTRLRDDARADGARLGVVVIPPKEQIYPEDFREFLRRYPTMRSRSRQWDIDLVDRRLSQGLRQREIPFLLLSTALRREAPHARTPLYLRQDQHPSAAGYQVFATAIQEWITGESLVPRP